LFIFNKQKQKAFQTIASTQFPTTASIGLLQPDAGLIAGDRGCLPTVSTDATKTAQTISAQLVLGQIVAAPLIGRSAVGVAADYGTMTSLLCSTSGVCCTTNLCNSMSRVEMSLAAMLMSMALALFGVLNRF